MPGLDDAQLFRRALERQPARVAALLDLARSLAQTRDLDEVLRRFSERAMEVTGGWWSSVSQYGAEQNQLLTLVDLGAGGDVEDRGAVYDLGRYPTTLAVLARQVAMQIRIDDPDADAAERKLLREAGCGAVLMLPLVAHGKAIGLIEVYSQKPHTFQEDEVVFCRFLCDVVAAAMQNAILTERLRRQADTDPLTGLWNRRVFDARLAAVLSDAESMPVSIAVVDVDDLKLINDRQGHPAGDRSLIAVADALTGAARLNDQVCRLGGDEFALIMPRTSRASAREICVDAVRRLSGAQPPVEFAAGVATANETGHTADHLYRLADESVYRSKSHRELTTS